MPRSQPLFNTKRSFNRTSDLRKKASVDCDGARKRVSSFNGKAVCTFSVAMAAEAAQLTPKSTTLDAEQQQLREFS